MNTQQQVSGILGLGASGSPAPNLVGPWSLAQIYTFKGRLTNSSEVSTYQFNVLAGPSRPNITAGWAKINVVDRPQRKGFTIPAGYDPITVDITVQFEALVAQYAISPNVEFDIQKMEWMAGRGKLFAAQISNGVGTAATGSPPIVTVASYTGKGQQSNLIPPNLQGVEWLVSNIAYDDSAYSDRSGNRLRAPVTITLTEYVPVNIQITTSPTARAKANNPNAATVQTRTTTAATNTLGKMAEKYIGQAVEAKQAILALNYLTLKIRSWNQTLPPGVSVVIPSKYINPFTGLTVPLN